MRFQPQLYYVSQHELLEPVKCNNHLQDNVITWNMCLLYAQHFSTDYIYIVYTEFTINILNKKYRVKNTGLYFDTIVENSGLID
jgi:hypothetical protein